MIDYSQPELDLSELGPCPPHYWKISEPEEKECHAVCLKCGEERTFSNVEKFRNTSQGGGAPVVFAPREIGVD